MLNRSISLLKASSAYFGKWSDSCNGWAAMA